MANTITAFYEFSAGSKARAAHVNTNFSNFRGDLVPINTDTATASDSAHDLGSSEHRWKGGYLGTINLEGSTSTTDVKLVPDTTVTSGAADLLFGTTTITSYDQYGIKPVSQGPLYATSTGNAKGQIVFSDFNNVSYANTSGVITLATIRFTPSHNGVYEYGTTPDPDYTSACQFSLVAVTSTGNAFGVGIEVLVGNTTSSLKYLETAPLHGGDFKFTTTSFNVGTQNQIGWPIGSIRGHYFSATANQEVVMVLRAQPAIGNPTYTVFTAIGRFYAKSCF